MNMEKKFVIVKAVKFVCKYVLPIVIGWLEGDSHAIQDMLCI